MTMTVQHIPFQSSHQRPQQRQVHFAKAAPSYSSVPSHAPRFGGTVGNAMLAVSVFLIGLAGTIHSSLQHQGAVKTAFKQEAATEALDLLLQIPLDDLQRHQLPKKATASGTQLFQFDAGLSKGTPDHFYTLTYNAAADGRSQVTLKKSLGASSATAGPSENINVATAYQRNYLQVAPTTGWASHHHVSIGFTQNADGSVMPGSMYFEFTEANDTENPHNSKDGQIKRLPIEDQQTIDRVAQRVKRLADKLAAQ